MLAVRPDFQSTSDPSTLIVYGQVSHPARIMEDLEFKEGTIAPVSPQHVFVKPGLEGARLSTGGWMDLSFDDRMTLKGPSELFLRCREKIMRSTSAFHLSLRQFLDAYLDFVWEKTTKYREELEQNVTELYSANDWVFSAWLPFPQAQILLPDSFDGRTPQFAELDLVFWTGESLTAVRLEGNETALKSKKRKLDYLLENHPYLNVISVQKDRLPDGHFPEELFPKEFCRYWENLKIPLGPSPPHMSLEPNRSVTE